MRAVHGRRGSHRLEQRFDALLIGMVDADRIAGPSDIDVLCREACFEIETLLRGDRSAMRTPMR